jgi:hypothetical protein
MRDAMMCPFCRTEAPLGGYAGAQMCGGSFTDREHPGTVRMLLVELDDAGELLPEDVRRLDDAKASYR